jgi:hypothetical protein
MRIAYYVLREAKPETVFFYGRRFLVLFISKFTGVGEWSTWFIVHSFIVRLHKRRVNVEENQGVTKICTLNLVSGSFDDNSLDGVPVIRADDRYT